ncbi:hypothetical protein [Sphingomonas aerophila]|nr:hypothetical protein [Sphingomonas aerophila]
MVSAGEPVHVRKILADQQGISEDLTGRAFTLGAWDTARNIDEKLEATVHTDTTPHYMEWKQNGSFTTRIKSAGTLNFEIAERLAEDTKETLASGKLTVIPSHPSIVSLNTGPISRHMLTIKRLNDATNDKDAEYQITYGPAPNIFPVAPSNTSAPTITGTPQQGQTLSALSGSWSGTSPTYAYQWLRNGTAITGATSQTYTLVAADVGTAVSVRVTASNSAGNATAISAATGSVSALVVAPANTVAPSISGTAQQGQVLTASPGTWSGTSPSYAYAWLRNGTAISGATSSTYTLVAADVGTTIQVRVTASNSAGNATATSASTSSVAAAPATPPTYTYGQLGVSPQAFTQGAAAGTVIGTISGKTIGSTITVSDPRLSVSSDGTQLLVGLTVSNANDVISANLIESGSDATNSGRASAISITVNPAQASAATVDFFSQDIASAPWYAGATSPSAIRDRVSGRTLATYEAWDGPLQKRVSKVRIFDPATKTWSAGCRMFDAQIVDDDHGVPALDIADNRRAYSFGGAHVNNSQLQVAMSAAGDFTSWTVQPGLTPSTYGYDGLAYPHPIAIGTKLYLYLRCQKNSTNRFLFGLLAGDIQTDGSVVWPSAITILMDFGADSRVYAVQPLVISQSGNDAVIRHACTFADSGDNYRQDAYCFDHDTAAGVLRDITGAFSRSTSSPMPLATARSSVRVTQHFENSLYGNVPAHTFDSAGNYQIAYSESASGSLDTQITTPVMERVLPAGSTVLGAPINTGAVVKQRYDVFNYVPMPNSRVDMYFCAEDARGYNRGGDIAYVSRTGPAGTWGSKVTIANAGYYLGLDRVTSVKHSDGSVRVLWGENVIPGGGSGGGLNATSGNARIFARSDAGNLTYPFQPRPETQAFAARLQVQPSATEMKALDALIACYVDDGIWAQADAIYVPAWLTPNTQAMSLNLVGDVYNMSILGSVTAQQVTGKTGYALKTNGVAGSYLRSSLIPSAATGLKYAQTSATLAIYPVSDEQEVGQAIGFDSGGTSGTAFIVPRNASNQYSMRVNDVAGSGSNLTGPATTAITMMVARRQSASPLKGLYKAGSQTATTFVNSSSSPVPNSAFCLLGTSATPASRQIGFAFMGSAINDTNLPIFEAPIHRYLIDMGVL